MKLEPGDIICPVCHGEYYDDHYHCPKCGDKGKLDWVENIMGIQRTYIKPGIYDKEVDYSEMIDLREKIKWKII